jgi:hypothetical protein
MDPATTALISKAGAESAEVLKKQSESFLSAILGKPAKALGGSFADRISARRYAN